MHNNNDIMLNKTVIDYTCISLQTAYLALLLQESDCTRHADKHITGCNKERAGLVTARILNHIPVGGSCYSVGRASCSCVWNSAAAPKPHQKLLQPTPAPSAVSYKVICSHILCTVTD
jgi:hypothetical protein